MISNITNFLNDLKRADVLGRQFSFDAKTGHTPYQRYLKKHIITLVKLHFYTVEVSITLLMALKGLEPLTKDMDLLSGLLYNLKPHNDMLVLLCPTHR